MKKASRTGKKENRQDRMVSEREPLHVNMESDSDDGDHHHNESSPSKERKQNLKKDFNNIALLMFLYFLQGIPLGLTGSLPFILSSRKVSYADQGTFSFAFWPFSLKLLWAPIVDSLYVKKFGRRKSWLIPIQYILGIFMILFADFIRQIIEVPHHNSHKEIFTLTAIFFMFTFLAATQDIAVDGWALTMLSKENVAWGSTCNTVGQTAGWFVGNVLFLTIESADFSNNYLRPLLGFESQSYGVVTIDKFMVFFGIIFLISTTLVMIFKKEVDNSQSETKKQSKSLEDNLSVKQTYGLMWQILWLAPIKSMILILLTVKIGFAAESMSFLKFIEAEVPKEKLGLLAVPLTPLQIMLPLILSKYTNGSRPFDLFIKAIPFRLLMQLVVAFWVYVTPYFKDENNNYPFYYFMICLLINSIHSIFTYSMFASQLAFFAKVSDKTIGGTYMTFLNTISNMGGNWPSTLALYLADFINVKHCSYDIQNSASGAPNATVLEQISINKCTSDLESSACESLGGKCFTTVDAFYVEIVACVIFGLIWITYFKKILYHLQSLPKKAWKIKKYPIA